MTAIRSPFEIAIDKMYPPPSKLSRYMYDPVGWCRDCVAWKDGEGLTSYQEEILTKLVSEGRASVRGPHGLGKTMLAALAVLWFATTREDARKDWKCPTTASAWRQLEHYLWPEIHKWAKRLRWDVLDRAPFNARTELQVLNLRLEWGSAFAVASDNAALIEGVHAVSVLYIFDESKTIPADTFDAAEGAFSGAGEDTPAEAFGLAQSTPGEPSGRFYEMHQRKPGLEDWWVRHVTKEEAITAGRVSREWTEKRKAQWGEDSAVYANRVDGEFHSSDADGVIPLEWVELANERWRAWRDAGFPGRSGLVIVGVDVARSGPDETVLAPRFGWNVDTLRRSRKESTTQTKGRAAALLGSHLQAKAIVDVIGIGAGVVDQLRDDGFDVVAFNAGEGTKRKDRSGELGFTNKRSAAWWGLRELLDPELGEAVALPPDDLLVGDLTAPHWRVSAGGKIQVEAKEEIFKRLKRSTDSGDAVVQAFWTDDDERKVTQRRYRDRRLSGR